MNKEQVDFIQIELINGITTTFADCKLYRTIYGIRILKDKKFTEYPYTSILRFQYEKHEYVFDEDD